MNVLVNLIVPSEADDPMPTGIAIGLDCDNQVTAAIVTDRAYLRPVVDLIQNEQAKVAMREVVETSVLPEQAEMSALVVTGRSAIMLAAVLEAALSTEMDIQRGSFQLPTLRDAVGMIVAAFRGATDGIGTLYVGYVDMDDLCHFYLFYSRSQVRGVLSSLHFMSPHESSAIRRLMVDNNLPEDSEHEPVHVMGFAAVYLCACLGAFDELEDEDEEVEEEGDPQQEELLD